MIFSQNDKSLLFSSTEIPDVFFTEYLPEASGNYLKVYFYMLFLSKHKSEVKINDLSKTLSLDFPDFKDALDYWESKGLLVKTTDGYILADIQEKELSKLYTPKVTSSPEQAVKSAESQYRAQTIELINTQFFQGFMNPSWYTDIDLWFSKYGFDDQVMVALFNYAHEKRSLHRNYVQATADAWSKNNVKTFNDLDSYFEKMEKRNSLNSAIAKKLNLFRKLTTYEEEDIAKWTENYGYGMDIIEIALKKASSNNKVRFDYIDTLLTDWNKKDLRTPDEVNEYLNSLKSVPQEKKAKAAKKPAAIDYTQSTFDNLSDLYDN